VVGDRLRHTGVLMANIAVNQKLYAMVVTQAKQKYRIYPSPGASHWVHKRYLELGGKFIDSEKESQKKEMARRFLEHSEHRDEHHESKRERFLKYHYNKHHNDNKRDTE
jgi:hypothetical protein